MWGAGSHDWSGLDEAESRRCLQLAVDLGCTFFDSAWGYGDGRSERLLGELLRANRERGLFAATKIPPKNRQWPSHRGDPIGDAFPPDHIRDYVERSLENLGSPRIDLIQFHVWEDAWADDDGWQRTMADLRAQGLVAAVGVSLNRWEPWNALRTIRTGLIDAIQVIYNIFDQAPEDELLPACRELGVAVIARVPFDEGSLTGTLSASSIWPTGDWRNIYFGPENLGPTVERVEALRSIVPADMTLADLALAFILANPDVSVVIPGMRKRRNVVANLQAGDAPPLDTTLLGLLRRHRWDRRPTSWSL
jgi:aryl-alcohol dehydrogenase-like predicted oxidoreductase